MPLRMTPPQLPYTTFGRNGWLLLDRHSTSFLICVVKEFKVVPSQRLGQKNNSRWGEDNEAENSGKCTLAYVGAHEPERWIGACWCIRGNWLE